VRSGPGKTAKNKKKRKKEKKSTVVSNKKKSTVMSPIQRRMKKRNPSGEQNGQLVHWWLLIHSGPYIALWIFSNGNIHQVEHLHLRDIKWKMGHKSYLMEFWL
jgi:hypothetical protein